MDTILFLDNTVPFYSYTFTSHFTWRGLLRRLLVEKKVGGRWDDQHLWARYTLTDIIQYFTSQVTVVYPSLEARLSISTENLSSSWCRLVSFFHTQILFTCFAVTFSHYPLLTSLKSYARRSHCRRNFSSFLLLGARTTLRRWPARITLHRRQLSALA
jgi:hypothetical protein